MTANRKHKKNHSDITDYNDMWLFRLYRQLGWHKIHMMKVQASPEACLAHIKRLADRTTYDYVIETQEENQPYEFEVDVMSITRAANYNYTSMATIVGTIVKDDKDDSKSIIAFRAYPGGIFSRLILTLTPLLALRLFGAFQTINPINVALTIIATIWLIFVWHAYFANRNEGLDLVTSHFLSFSRLAEKMKTDERQRVENDLYEQQAQK